MKKTIEFCFFKTIESPLGTIILVVSEAGLKEVLFNPCESKWENRYINLKRGTTNRLLIKTEKQLQEYFAQKRRNFDLPIAHEGTEFQKKTWDCLLKIPYGHTISYGEQAQMMGNQKKARAVGFANSKNPISIIVPCHRVIGKNGALTGYAGGLDKKKFLLNLEKTNLG